MTTEDVGLGPKTVHVIDDDAPVRRALAMLLRSAGIEAKLYASGPAFLDAVQDFNGVQCVLRTCACPA
jgi:FixJ family two-component response regulator